MSRTYNIVCKTCCQHLWVGQGWPPEKGAEDKRYLYSGPLGPFLFKHLSTELHDNGRTTTYHHLVFMDSEQLALDAAFDKARWTELCPDCGAVPPCAHEPADEED